MDLQLLSFDVIMRKALRGPSWLYRGARLGLLWRPALRGSAQARQFSGGTAQEDAFEQFQQYNFGNQQLAKEVEPAESSHRRSSR